ncbi:DinB family protein [Nocardioides sp. SYSU D00038]|uniref:DinB family protein n=1 Tax=Nocardioides sp. SYSU D00038 TaxID=2812554 RepID=UPI0019689243|nr:DinB family protein [Nocardioides sp. SYSU D00038]
MTTDQSTQTDPAPASLLDPERADLLDTLHKHRALFRFTAQGITDVQAAERTTVSELTLAGLVKHVTATERMWADFIVDGPAELPQIDWDAIDWTNPPPEVRAYQDAFRMVEGETLAGLLDDYDAVAARTDELVRTLPDLDASQPLPAAPWFPEGARWSARRVLLHLIAETTQHAGHADIIRESLDGQRSMA